jgi:hypothetical protein
MTTHTVYEAIANTLLARADKAPLVPTEVHDAAMCTRIDALRVPVIVRGALHLLNDDLPRSHAIAQAQEGERSFDYLHAIVHRREGDYGNAKYWFGRVASHPVLHEVYGPDPCEALRFVDRCRRASQRPSDELLRVQALEFSALLAYVANPPR